MYLANFKLLYSYLQPAVVHLQGQGSAIQVKNGKISKRLSASNLNLIGGVF